jgi:peptidoglycan/LPS O-acetylase OafA/YrhL
MAAAVAAAIVASLLVHRWIERPVLDRLHQRFAR